MWHLHADVDCAFHFLDRVHVLGKTFPVPLNAFIERGAGNVFDAFHQADQKFFLARLDRREADAAVAHHQRGDAVPARRSEIRVPGDLAVVVGVDVDEAGGDEESGRVDFAPGRASRGADRSDLAAIDSDIADEAGLAGSIDHFSIADYEVMHALGSSRRL